MSESNKKLCIRWLKSTPCGASSPPPGAGAGRGHRIGSFGWGRAAELVAHPLAAVMDSSNISIKALFAIFNSLLISTVGRSDQLGRTSLPLYGLCRVGRVRQSWAAFWSVQSLSASAYLASQTTPEAPNQALHLKRRPQKRTNNIEWPVINSPMAAKRLHASLLDPIATESPTGRSPTGIGSPCSQR